MTGFVVGLLVMLVLGLVTCNAYRRRPLSVTADVPLVDTSVDLDPVLFRRLQAVQGVALVNAGHGRYTLEHSRIPGSAIIGAVIFFPVGLALLLLRLRRRLDLVVVPTATGSALRITGTVEAHVWRRVSRALAPLIGEEQPTPSDVDVRR